LICRSVPPERNIHLFTDIDHFLAGITIADLYLDLRSEAHYYRTLRSTMATADDPPMSALHPRNIRTSR